MAKQFSSEFSLLAPENKDQRTVVYESQRDKAISALAFSPIGMLAGMVDTTGQSLGIIEDENTVPELLKNVIGGDAASLYEENKSAYQLAGDIALVALPALAVPKILRSGSFAMNALSKIPGGARLEKVIATSGKGRDERIAAIADEMKVFAEQGLQDIRALPTLEKKLQSEKLGAAFDSLRENFAIDAVLYTYANESDWLFPAEDNPLSNAMLFGGINLGFAWGAYKFTGAALKRTLADIDKFANEAERARNRGGIVFSEVLSEPEKRGIAIASSSAMYNDAVAFAQKSDIAVEGTSAAVDRSNTALEWLRRQIKLGFKDNAFPENKSLDYSFKMDVAEGPVKTAEAFFTNEPTMGLAVTSLQPIRKETKTLVKNWDAKLDNVSVELRELTTELNVAMDAGASEGVITNLRKKVEKKTVELAKLQNSAPFVVETNLEVVPLRYRKFTLYDDPAAIQIRVKDEGYELQSKIANEVGVSIAYTNRGSLTLKEHVPPLQQKLVEQNIEEQAVSGINVQRKLSATDVRHEIEREQKLNLLDISFTYSKTGRIGQDLFATMPQEFKGALDRWKSSSNLGPIRSWGKNNPKKLLELQSYFKRAGLHRRLYELADKDGFIPLYRGASGTNSEDIVSMATNVEFADKMFGRGAGKNTYKVNVPVEDVIAIIDRGRPQDFDAFGRLKPNKRFSIENEFEIIVKGNKGRIPYEEYKKQLRVQKAKATRAAHPAEQKLLTLEAITTEQTMAVWATTRKVIEKFRNEIETLKSGEEVGKWMIKPESSYIEYDAAIELLRKYPEVPIVNYIPNPGMANDVLLKELEFRSFLKKAEAYWTQMQVVNGAKTGILKIKPDQIASKYDILRRLNLPSNLGYDWHPVVKLLDAYQPAVGDSIPKANELFKSLDEIYAQVGELVRPAKLFEPRKLATDYKLDGQLLDLNIPSDRAPFVAIMKNIANNRIGPEELNKMILASKAERWVKLKSAEANGVKGLAAFIQGASTDSENFKTALQVQKLIESTQAGKGTFTSNAFNLRFNEILKAADLAMDRAGKQYLQYVNTQVFNENVHKIFSQVAAERNSASRQSIEFAISELRRGWDVLPDLVEIAPGKFALALDRTSARNKKIFESVYRGKEFKLLTAKEAEDAEPILMTFAFDETKPVVLDELGRAGLETITNLSHQYLDEVNYLRMVEGLAPIPKRNWHVPFYDIRDKNALYLVDETGSVITQVLGKTEDEVLRNAQKEIAELKKLDVRASIQSEAYVRQHIQASGSEFMPKQNFGRAGTQTGGIKGKAATYTVQLDTFKPVLEQLQSNFVSLQQHYASVIFRPQIEYGRGIKQFMSTLGDKAKENSSIFDMLERAYLQKSALNENSALGKFWYGFENSADMFWAKLWDKYHKFVPKSVSPTQKEFERLNQHLGKDYNPFPEFTKFVEQTNKIKSPMTQRDVVGKMARVTTNLVLRIADPGMYLINMAGVAGVAPAVIAALQKGADETELQWLRRTGFISSPMGENFALPSTAKLMQLAVESFFDPDTRRALQIATDRYGLMKQEVAERLEIMLSPLESTSQRSIRKFIDNASWFTDKSEVLSRKLSFGMGYNIARKAGGLEFEDAILFAHKFANDVVGDYRAINRPQIFQGATGMPFSLFTTWMWNWLQRVYGDLEGGRLSAIAMQAGIQQFLFGAESLPGYNKAVEFFTTSYNGSMNFTDKLNNAFGTPATDFWMSGVLANVPKLFMGDGMAIQTRAAVGIPAIVQAGFDGNFFEAMPAYRTFTDIYKGTSEVIQQIYENGDYTKEQFLETLAQYGVNGAVKTMAELSLNASVDRNKNLVNRNLQTVPETFARLFELRTLTEKRIQRQLAKDKMRAAIKREHLMRLGKQVKTKLRNGTLDGAALAQITRDAIRAGIAPGNLRSWWRDQAIASMFTLDERRIMKAATTTQEMKSVIRLMELMQDQQGY